MEVIVSSDHAGCASRADLIAALMSDDDATGMEVMDWAVDGSMTFMTRTGTFGTGMMRSFTDSNAESKSESDADADKDDCGCGVVQVPLL